MVAGGVRLPSMLQNFYYSPKILKIMKSLEKLSEAYDLLSKKYIGDKEDDEIGLAILKIHEFIVDNTPVKKGDLSVWDCVTKNKNDLKYRPNLGAVFHDNEARVAVSTDCHILFVNPSEYIDSTEKPSDCDQQFEYDGYTGLMRDKYGKPSYSGKYVNWRTVFLKDAMPFEVRKDLSDVRDIATSNAKLNGKKKYQVCINEEHDIWISSVYVDLVLRAGIDGWKCSTESPNKRALVKEWSDGRKLLLMPMMPPEQDERCEEDGYDAANKVKFLD